MSHDRTVIATDQAPAAVGPPAQEVAPLLEDVRERERGPARSYARWRSARRAIYVQAYVFTSRRLARSLVEAKERGVAVEVLADREMMRKGERSRIPQLAAAGIPVRLEFRYPAAHNKVIVVDPLLPRNAVVTGSYNFTYAARARNAENLLVLRDNPPLARAYYDNFLRHWDGAAPYEKPPSQR